MRFTNPPSCLDSAMEREAVNKGLVKNPVFPENIPTRNKTEDFPAVIKAREIVTKQAERYKEMMGWGEPAPIENGKPAVYTLVLEDVQERAKFGYTKYKTFLQPGNGRNALKDAYEEALDLCMYLRQKLYEEQGK